MRKRRFGRTGFEVSEVGFGCWQIGGTMWGAVDINEAKAAMHRAIELGVNFFDTALVYGMGRSEELVGKVFRDLPKRHEIKVATKIPPKNLTWPASSKTPLAQAYPVDHIQSTLETCLRNLAMERVDLLQLHVWADEWAADDKLWRALEDAKKAGKIGAVGISLNAGRPASGLLAVESGHIDTVQVVYNLFDQQPEDVLFPACAKHDVGVIARVPFDEGGLTGRLIGDEVFADDDFRHRYFAGDLLRETVQRATNCVRFS
jgi:aryl-alcohol dehydrogenase-like predicted oxidoreductase